MSNETLDNDLNNQWKLLVAKYSENAGVVDKLFSDIRSAHSSQNRYYHNLRHLHSLLQLSGKYRNHLHDKDVVDFSIFYHDIVYEILKSDNEERSARIAKKHLEILKLPERKIIDIMRYIEASKNHTLNEADNESDLAWFLDFDMSILGTDWYNYLEYSRQVRNEYGIYPDLIYNQERKKFLKRCLEMSSIFHTYEFRSEYEQRARQNMQKELLQF